MYASAAGIPARTSHVPRGVVRTLAAVAGPIHPGVARVTRISSLPDDAVSETQDAGDTGVAHVVDSTTLEAFVKERVLEHRAAR